MIKLHLNFLLFFISLNTNEIHLNYLAHLFLSGLDEEVLIGNFIGDYVKGRSFMRFSEKVRKGITLHRNIDMFTDTNTIVRASKSRFSEQYGKYSGVIIDIFYDHFLTRNWDKFCSIDLFSFAGKVYKILNKNFAVLPEEVQLFIPSFINNRWLTAYQSLKGIDLVLRKMSKRTSLPDHTEFAIQVLNEEYDFIDEEFLAYFPKLMEYVNKNFCIEFV